MKIALIGYGKMGKTIENIALNNGDEVVLKIGQANRNELNVENLRKADVAIEFTRPEFAYENILHCLIAGVPVVSGTTGWTDKLVAAKKFCKERDGAFFYASNFSVGVNIFFAISRQLCDVMNQYTDYNARIEEIHHTQKLDAPSGTAITLANHVLEHLNRKKKWVAHPQKASEELAIVSKRLDNVPGTHVLEFSSPIDTIELVHTAHSREGFASGALMAARWLVGKKGFFEMKDMLGF